MNTPPNNLNQIPTPSPIHKIEELIDNNQSPIKLLKYIPINSLNFSLSPVFVTPQATRSGVLCFTCTYIKSLPCPSRHLNKKLTQDSEHTRIGRDLPKMSAENDDEDNWKRILSDVEPQVLLEDLYQLRNFTNETCNTRNLYRGLHQNAVVTSSSSNPRNAMTQTGEDRGQDGQKSLNLEDLTPKRHKSEEGRENKKPSCKRCNCKKTKCLKLYCDCFAAGVYCTEPCSCIECLNKHKHEDKVLAARKQIETRNPLAFTPKVIRISQSMVQKGDGSSGKTSGSARHKRGCNCKKSTCLKRYCECYQSGVGCSVNCRCEGCKNSFGRKYGSNENEQDKENEMCDQVLQHNIYSTPLRTPLGELANNQNFYTPPPAPFRDGSSSSNLFKSIEMINRTMPRDLEPVNGTPMMIRDERGDQVMSEFTVQVPRGNNNNIAAESWRNASSRKLVFIPKFPDLYR